MIQPKKFQNPIRGFTSKDRPEQLPPSQLLGPRTGYDSRNHELFDQSDLAPMPRVPNLVDPRMQALKPQDMPVTVDPRIGALPMQREQGWFGPAAPQMSPEVQRMIRALTGKQI